MPVARTLWNGEEKEGKGIGNSGMYVEVYIETSEFLVAALANDI